VNRVFLYVEGNTFVDGRNQSVNTMGSKLLTATDLLNGSFFAKQPPEYQEPYDDLGIITPRDVLHWRCAMTIRFQMMDASPSTITKNKNRLFRGHMYSAQRL
jgi:hypothetical protein